MIESAGGLHRFMGWDSVLATDSGGFQVFSLRHGQVADELKGRRRLPPAEGDPIDAVRVDEEGADFRSYLDGRRHRFTPENNMALQRSLGADLLFCLDECTPFHVPPEYTRAATERNARWARRCLEAFDSLAMGERQALYGIVHGGVYPELRRFSAGAMSELGFAGFGIGDCLGETKTDWYGLVELVCGLVPAGKPRHLLGVGEPDDLVEGALRGIDTFDCAMPTRIARHGMVLVPDPDGRWRTDLAKSRARDDDGPMMDDCPCPACAAGYSRAYLHHLLRARELTAMRLITVHNLAFIARLMADLRAAIAAGTLAETAAALRAGAAPGAVAT
jgi:queuine tRNA-ribosyltransferase